MPAPLFSPTASHAPAKRCAGQTKGEGVAPSPFDNFRQEATDNGGVITDDMIEELRGEVARGLQQSRENIDMMQEEDYI